MGGGTGKGRKVSKMIATSESSQRLLGAHMPTTGGLQNSLINGKSIGCNAVQLFTASPRQWNSPGVDTQAAELFRCTQTEQGIRFTVAHDSYLINLCAPDPSVLLRSKNAFRGELDRAEALGIPWVVTHMGSHLNSGEETGLELISRSIDEILKETEGYHNGVALETTAGQGSNLGYKFEHLAKVIELCDGSERIGVCLDTCHLFAAGYELRDEDSYRQTFDEFDRVIGLNRLKVIHANDAKKPLGSHVDRHEHLGEGEIGMEMFCRLVNDPKLFHIPVIIETPESEKMHPVNLKRLKDCLLG